MLGEEHKESRAKGLKSKEERGQRTKDRAKTIEERSNGLKSKEERAKSKEDLPTMGHC